MLRDIAINSTKKTKKTQKTLKGIAKTKRTTTISEKTKKSIISVKLLITQLTNLELLLNDLLSKVVQKNQTTIEPFKVIYSFIMQQ